MGTKMEIVAFYFDDNAYFAYLCADLITHMAIFYTHLSGVASEKQLKTKNKNINHEK